MAIAIDTDRYLARIGLGSPPPLTEDGLAELMTGHLHHVPFENLDIPLGRPIHLETDHLYEKIVGRRRGGYCFELNGLFGTLLDALGFERFPAMARVWYRAPAEVPATTHTLNLVQLNGRLLMADVGFGGTTSRGPVPLEDGARVTDRDGEVSLRRNEDFGFVLTRHLPGGPQDQFSTDGRRAHPADLAMANHFVSTHPSSHFTKMACAGLFTPDGRTGLTDLTLTTRMGWSDTNETVTSAARYREVLDELFGIDLEGRHEEIYEQLTVSDSSP